MMRTTQRGKTVTDAGKDAFQRVLIRHYLRQALERVLARFSLVLHGRSPRSSAGARQADYFTKPLTGWSWFRVLLLLWTNGAGAAEVIPPAPDHYFNDYANVVSAATGERLEAQLKAFEKETSNQILVALFPKMQSDSSIEDYTVRVARAWRVGQKARNNGAILFIFVQDHKMRIEVGYGLEGALPDALAKRIIEEEIKPHFQKNDYDGGVVAGV